jgi:hypothetical protein
VDIGLLGKPVERRHPKGYISVKGFRIHRIRSAATLRLSCSSQVLDTMLAHTECAFYHDPWTAFPGQLKGNAPAD